MISLYFFSASAASIAFATSGESGVVFGSNRASIFPSRPITNFPKFHLTSPGNGAPDPVNAVYNGCCSAPFTCSFSNSGNVTSYFDEQNVLISCADPGSCDAKSLHGNPSTVNPLA